MVVMFFFFNDTATTEIYTLSLHDALPIYSGPHMPWFWRGELQGGGVLNDMMCHSALVVRHLLTRPGEPLSTVRPVRVTAHIASLKWTRPSYSKLLAERMGKDVDYAKAPSEDFASTTIQFET